MSYRTLVNYIEEDNLEEFRNLLAGRRVVVDDRDETGSTALHFACSEGKLAFVKELLEYGANVDVEDNDNWTPLLCAAKEGFTEICIELLEHGADVDHRDMGKWNSLMWTSYKNHVSTVIALIERGANVNSYEAYHISPLTWASGRGHGRIVELLISKGAKVNTGDKYGTTPLVWASRRGDIETVQTLLNAGANVDLSGVYSWTPLLVATMRNHVDVVNLLLQYKPNVNIVDTDGCSPLTIACKEGYYDIVTSLLNAGAFINGQDRYGDTNLIHATRNGHTAIVEALLAKYADVNVPGKDYKTPLYIAAEKGYLPIFKLILNARPNLDCITKDGDTVLLRAVRSRNYEMVKLILDKNVRVEVCDKKGDTALHIAMRSSSKKIVELLLRNPIYGKLLYRPNNSGETPFMIDMRHPKPLLSQVYGSNRLNTNEDHKNMLGYDLYSSTLADMLSSPSVSMPITVGLYARWGSGKNFLLKHLNDEMKIFSQQWVEPLFRFYYILMMVALHITLFFGFLAFILTQSVYYAVATVVLSLSFIYLAFIAIAYGSLKFNGLRKLNLFIMRKEDEIKIILQILFCNPQGIKWKSSLGSKPIRYYFTDHSRVSSTTGGENAVVQMIGSLFDAMEQDLGVLPTRLYRAFTPKADDHNSSWHWRRVCCIPAILLFELNYINILLMSILYYLYYNPYYRRKFDFQDQILYYLLLFCTTCFTLFIVSNLRTWGILIKSLITSPRRRLQQAISSLDVIRSEGFLQTLRHEVSTLINMVRCFDAFTNQQTRLVIIVDGLDSCEQDKVLLILDAVHVLFSENNSPFIIILAIDPHVISMVVETNTRRLLNESNITGRDFLRNMVHVPFYLQNYDLRKANDAQRCAIQRKTMYASQYNDEPVRRSSNESNIGSSERLKVPGSNSGSGSTMRRASRNNSRKLKISDSVNSSIASNMNKLSGAQDLTTILTADDYFIDMNPRCMRRLLNIVYITGRLLKSFQIDFSWYQLAVWIHIVEQWPYRTSCIILYHEANEDTIDENMSLKAVYNKIRPYLKTSKELDPLLEFDKDEKKFNVFLKFHQSSFLVIDLRIFLPFTINLDPYIKKVIKEEQQYLEDRGVLMNLGYPGFQGHHSFSSQNTSTYSIRKPLYRRPVRNLVKYPQPEVMNATLPASFTQSPVTSMPQQPIIPTARWSSIAPAAVLHAGSWLQSNSSKQIEFDSALLSAIPEEFHNRRLSTLTRECVCELLYSIKELHNTQCLPSYANLIIQNNICGRVLICCNIDELKKTLNMKFGDWELFNSVIIAMRELEYQKNLFDRDQKEELNMPKTSQNYHPERTGSFSKGNTNNAISPIQDQRDGCSKHASKQTITEKQVSLEDQMLCGALQTLNEEACEDVLGESNELQEIITRPDALMEIPVCEPDVIGYKQNTTNQQENVNLNFEGTSEVDHLLENTVNCYWRPTLSDQNINNSNNENDLTNNGNSICSTPLQKRKSPSLYEKEWKTSIKPRSRPSSLLVPNVEDGQQNLVICENETQHQQHAAVARSHSVDSACCVSSLSASKFEYHFNNAIVTTAAPMTVVSSSCSSNLDALNLNIDNNDDDDDESTPLVSDVSSPQSPQKKNSTVYKIEIAKDRDNVRFMCSQSDLISPTSVKSNDTRDTSASADSLNNLSTTPEPRPFCQLAYVNERNCNSSDDSSQNCELLFIGDTAQDDVSKYSWSDTETTV